MQEPAGRRIDRVQAWLVGRADTSLGRLGLEWFRRYFEASRNSGCALTVYASLSVLPAVLVAVAVLHPSQDNANFYAQHLVAHVGLTGQTAKLVEGTFGTASANALAASLTVVVSFLFWGIGIGQIYQDVYVRAWRLEKASSLADQGLFAGFFFLLAGAMALWLLSATQLRAAGWLVLVPAWVIGSTGFWLWVPSLLLHRRIGWRALLPGALMASLVIGGSLAFSPLFLASPLNVNGKSFGSFGVVLTTVGYVFVLLTMSLVCAVFSPVWVTWRQSERRNGLGPSDAAGSPA
jgi:membrane protein